jgi:hypothetical protein
MSRVTLHRIERGEPSVTIGAYLGVAAALGWALGVQSLHRSESQPSPESLPSFVPRNALADYPQLRALAWSTPGLASVTPEEALSLYERGWRHVDAAALEPDERALGDALVDGVGKGRLLV